MNYYYQGGDPRKPRMMQLCEECAELIKVGYENNEGFKLDMRYRIGTPSICENCKRRFAWLNMYRLEYR